MLLDWQDLIPGPKAVTLRTRYRTLKKRVLSLSDTLVVDEEEHGEAGGSLVDPIDNPAAQSSPNRPTDPKLEPNSYA